MIKQRSILISSAFILVGAFFVGQLILTPVNAQTKKVYNTQTYSQARAKIENKEIDKIYKLARKFYSKGSKDIKLLKLIAADLKQTLKVEKNSRIKTLLKIINAKIKKLKKSGDNNSGNDSSNNNSSSEDNSGKGELLTEKQINLIRLFEITDKDTSVKIKFEGKVLKTYIAKMLKKQIAGWDDKNAAKKFMKKSNVKKLLEIREMFPSDLKLLSKIKVNSDPVVIKQFKQRIWPLVKNSCAKSACHGSKKGAGGFRLIRGGKDKNKVFYSNFMILRGYKASGKYANEQLLNTDEPERSLLLTFGSPPSDDDDNAALTHPKKIQVAFPNEKNKRYKAVIGWIKSLNGPTAINYLFKWDAPNKMKVQTQGESLTGL